jgi:hypothetical protein
MDQNLKEYYSDSRGAAREKFIILLAQSRIGDKPLF